MRNDRQGNSRGDKWRTWRVTEPEPDFLRSRPRRRRPLPSEPIVRDWPMRRWWHV
jgi:hypothetical protein